MVTQKGSELKTLKIKAQTHKDLEDLFVGRDTFDNVINRLIVAKKNLDTLMVMLTKRDRGKIESKLKEAFEELL